MAIQLTKEKVKFRAKEILWNLYLSWIFYTALPYLLKLYGYVRTLRKSNTV